MHAFIDARLVGAKGAAALQHQGNRFVIELHGFFRHGCLPFPGLFGLVNRCGSHVSLTESCLILPLNKGAVQQERRLQLFPFENDCTRMEALYRFAGLPVM